MVEQFAIPQYSVVRREAAQARLKNRMEAIHRPPARTAWLLCAALATAGGAQTHKVTKPQTVVRAIGVYEWTGDLAKPNGSRLIPVTIYINGKLEDAGVYMAQPVPFALDSGNLYELQKAGVPQGTLALAFARKLTALPTDAALYDDGWFGYGRFHAPAPPKKSSNLRTVAKVAKINGVDDEDDDKPHFSARSATPGSGGAATPTPGSAPAATSTPADDPDRPVMRRHADDASDTGDVPDDPDRPTLRKRPTGTANGKPEASVSGVGSLNNDPDRPILQRGKPEGLESEADLPQLKGLPTDTDLQQMVAVSDAADRPEHDFSRSWSDDSERASVLSTMEDAAHGALTTYEQANGLKPVGVASAAAPPPATAKRSGAAARRSAAKKVAVAPPPPPEPLLDEKLETYSLSYGGSPTFVYSAHTGGIGTQERFVTIVAQKNLQDVLEIALKSVTDAAHLDRTPRMKLVDAVDAEASNRASLLFEMRAQSSRQFALYRVIGGQATQTFITGSTR